MTRWKSTAELVRFRADVSGNQEAVIDGDVLKTALRDRARAFAIPDGAAVGTEL